MRKVGFRFLVNELLELWERINSPDKRLTYETLAELMRKRFSRKYTGPNLGQLIQGTSKSPSLDTKQQIRTVLEEQLRKSESVDSGRLESVTSHVPLRDRPVEYSAPSWQTRAEAAEAKLSIVKATLRELMEIVDDRPNSGNVRAVVDQVLASVEGGRGPKGK